MSALPLIVLLALAAGCGGDSGAQAPAEHTPTVDRRAGLDPEKTELRRAADAYWAALYRKDFKGVCDTLAPSERRYYAREAQGCPNAFEAIRFTGRGKRRHLRDFRAAEVRIRGDRAVISITTTTSNTVIGRLHALREDGRWGISRKK